MEIVIQTIYDLPRTAEGLIAAMGGCRMDYALGGVAGTRLYCLTTRQKRIIPQGCRRLLGDLLVHLRRRLPGRLLQQRAARARLAALH